MAMAKKKEKKPITTCASSRHITKLFSCLYYLDVYGHNSLYSCNAVKNKTKITKKVTSPGTCIIKLIAAIINYVTQKASVFVKASKK
jgi:hypothetical protein